MMKKNILLLDDSALMRRVLSDIINETEEYQVAYQASNGLEGLDILDKNDVDLILLDMHMPKMNGVEFLRVLKENDVHIPVIIISGYSKRDTKDTIEALALGALEFVGKPENILESKDAFGASIKKYLGCASAQTHTVCDVLPGRATCHEKKKKASGKGMIVAIACSTGGPKALQEVIPMLPKNLNAPVLVVQHMPAGFTKSLADRLNQLSDIHVKEAQDNEALENGCVYIAKGGTHLTVEPRRTGHAIVFSDAPPVNGLRPCANNMYVSLNQSGYEKIVCVVMTGMGADGTQGIQCLNQNKPVYVISQDAETSTIYGMPRAIAQSGIVDEIRPLKEIAEAIIKQVGVQ